MATKLIIGKSSNKKSDSWTVTIAWVALSLLTFPIIFFFIESIIGFILIEFGLLLVSFFLFRFPPSDSLLYMKQQARESLLTSTEHKDPGKIINFRDLPEIKKVINTREGGRGE